MKEKSQTWKVNELYAFDLDKTLIRVNSSFKFYFFLYRLKFFHTRSIFFSLSYFLRHRFFHMSLKELHYKCFKNFLKGKKWDTLLSHVETFLDCNLNKMLNPSIIHYMKKAQREGHYTMILSSSPSFLVEPIAKRLGVSDWKATEYHIEQGRVGKISSLILGEEKATCIIEAAKRWGIDSQKIIAFSDSCCDLPFLRSAGRAIAVNPDRTLKKHCKKFGWEIID